MTSGAEAGDGAAAAAAAARAWLDDPGAAPPPGVPAAALAWALKDACYAAWSKAPRDAVRAAALLARLAATAPEVRAVADWCAGIAALSEGRLAAAAAAFDAAAAAFDAAGDGQHAAETQVPKVVALSMLGRHDDALVCAQEAHGRFVASGDLRSAGKVELNLGTMLSRRDRHAEAAAQYRRAAVRFARVGDTEHSVMADIGLANALTWQYELGEALRVNARARMRAEAHGFDVLRALAHGAIGRIELNRGRLPLALRELAAASRVLAEAGAPPPRILEAESALADAYLAANLLPEAVALYDRVVAQSEALDLPTERARALLDRARARLRLGEVDAALTGFTQARALFEAEGNAASVAFVDLAQGAAELAAGRIDEARESARQARDALAATGIVGWRLEAEGLVAEAAAAAGDSAAAETGFARTLAEGEALAPIALGCHRGLGALALRRGDLATARSHLETALRAVDAVRAALPGDPFRTAWGAEGEAAHDLLVETVLAQGDARALLDAIDGGRAQALALALQGRDGPAGSATAAARERLRWATGRRAEALADGDAVTLAALDTEVARREAELLETERRERLAAAGDSAPSTSAAQPASVAAELPAALQPGEAVVVWHRLGGRLVAAVATSRGLVAREARIDGFDARLQGLRFQVDALRFGGDALCRHAAQALQRVRGHLQALHALLWAPVAPLLDGAERVVLLPHRELHYVPFAALHDGAQWLVERHEMCVAPGVGAWLAGRRVPAPPPRRVLAVGVSGATLPQVAAEIDAVAAAFVGVPGGAVRVLRDDAARLPALRGALPGSDVLHLACHGRFRADSPMFSALELADGPLALHDVAALPLDATLAVLSACDTGASRIAPGDERVGLVRAFFAAGARAVLASQWAVADDSTARLMADFYRALVAGATPAAALRQAQRVQAAAGAHPYHWAAFSLHERG